MEPSAYIDRLFSILRDIKITQYGGSPLELGPATDIIIGEIKGYSARGNKLIFIGNGGSAAIAGHQAIDFSKNAKIRSMSFNEAILLTCLGNDYGYDNVFEKSLEIFAEPGDLLIAISSSGRSPNILKAVDAARRIGCGVITFSGFGEDNPLRKSGDYNYYIKSGSYGFVELSHQILLHMMVDLITKEWQK